MHDRAGSDLDIRIANSRIGLRGWTREAESPAADFHQIATICGTEISLLRGLKRLDTEQRTVVDALLARWTELRDLCAAKPKRARPRRQPY